MAIQGMFGIVLKNTKRKLPTLNSVFVAVVILGISWNCVLSKSLKSTCSQVGKPEENVTLMYGMHNPSVKHDLIGHVKSLKDCVKLACRRENVSLAYTSRFDCYSVTCTGEEELCWFLPSFNHPSLLFARLERGKNQKFNEAKHATAATKTKNKKGKKQH